MLKSAFALWISKQMYAYSYDVLFSQKDCDEIIRLSQTADACEGGALEISLGSQVVTGAREQGSATLSAGFMLHRVVPVSRGTRYSLTCWSHGPRFRRTDLFIATRNGRGS